MISTNSQYLWTCGSNNLRAAAVAVAVFIFKKSMLTLLVELLYSELFAYRTQKFQARTAMPTCSLMALSVERIYLSFTIYNMTQSNSARIGKCLLITTVFLAICNKNRYKQWWAQHGNQQVGELFKFCKVI